MSKITKEGCPNGVIVIAWYEWVTILKPIWSGVRPYCKNTVLDYGFVKENCDISNLEIFSFLYFGVAILKFVLGFNLLKGKIWAHSLEMVFSGGVVLGLIGYYLFSNVFFSPLVIFSLPFLISNLIIVFYLNRPTARGYFYGTPSQESEKIKNP